jgi:hypothetical protein
MKRQVAAAALLLMAAGCDRMVTCEPQQTYALWEEGRTLVFADPARPGSDRLQVRVSKSDFGPDGRTVVETFATLAGQTQFTLRQQDGLVALKLEGQGEALLLPKGFPDRVWRWETRGYLHSVVGRGRVDLPGVNLPDPDVTGVWVESLPLDAPGVMRRTLVVPNLGEVMTLNWIGGKWVKVNVLVSQGFTDAPSTGSGK